MNSKRTWLAALAVLGVLAWLPACGGDSQIDPDGGDDTPAETTGDTPGADADDVPVADDGTIPDTAADGSPCGTTQCSNCLDDDGDGFTDGFDAHCSGAADNDEGTFSTGIPGDNIDLYTQDCFFDGNSGGGGDCAFHTCCLLRDACPPAIRDHGGGFDPATDCDLSDSCIENCLPGVTPGCDCFGCCEIWVDDVAYTVFTNPAVSPDCTLDVIADPTRCLPCTPTADCSNPCVPAECELCPGMSIDDLPPECDPTHPQCDDGVVACDTTADCPENFYCSLGCCIENIIVT